MSDPAVHVLHTVEADLRSELDAWFDRTRRSDGSRPLSDHLWIDLRDGGGPGFVAALQRRSDPSARPTAYAQASLAASGHTVEVVVDPSIPDVASTTDRLLDAVIGEIVSTGHPADLTWWVAEPDTVHDAIAARRGWTAHRTLLQMRCPLPVDRRPTVTTRSYRPGADDEQWLRVNNRAFRGHGEQGAWDLATLRARFDEPWFRPDDFLVLERDGEFVGSCWTKPHDDTEPPMGEIYVVSVDPDHHGQGLGRELTIAGLDAIHARGFDTAMLYVDADNVAALRVYRSLGFEVHRTDRAYTGTVVP